MNEQNAQNNKAKFSPVIIGFLLVLSVVLAIWAGFSFVQSHRYKTQLENTYLRAIEETSTNMSNISSDLVKGLYAGTPTQMSLVSSKLWKEASTAKSALSALPVAELNLENTYRFLSQVGDYAMYLSKKSVSDQRITSEERQQFLALREYADRLSAQVQQLEQKLASGKMAVGELAMLQADNLSGVDTKGDSSTDRYNTTPSQNGEVGPAADPDTNETNPNAENQQEPITRNGVDMTNSGQIKNSLSQTVSAPAVTGKGTGEQDSQSAPASEDRGGNNDFSAMEKGFIGYPSLIYDGPFSDHILDKKPAMTENQTEITQSEAKAKAAKAAQVSEDQLTNVRDEDSALPSYVFYNDGLSIAVTKNGGFLSYMVKPKPDGVIAARLSKEEAISAAQKYLESLGIQNMKDTYYEINNGLMTINFAHYESGTQVTCYTDLIKVQVSMETGMVMGFDCRGYLVNHKSRTFEQPKISREDAQKVLSENLAVENVRMALIPTDGKNEVYAYEFLCTGTTGDKVLVYVNADTAVEEQIFILIENENGVLTK